MFPITLLLNPCTLAISLCTATGVFVHDMQLDKATTTALALPAIIATYSQAGMARTEDHTHVERESLAQSLHDLRSVTPRMLPRDDHRKHVLSKRVVRGVHAFDGYYVPLGEDI